MTQMIHATNDIHAQMTSTLQQHLARSWNPPAGTRDGTLRIRAFALNKSVGRAAIHPILIGPIIAFIIGWLSFGTDPGAWGPRVDNDEADDILLHTLSSLDEHERACSLHLTQIVLSRLLIRQIQV